VTDVSLVDGLVIVGFENLVDGGGRSGHAVLVTAADSSGSSVRQLLLLNTTSAWYDGRGRCCRGDYGSLQPEDHHLCDEQKLHNPVVPP